MTSPTIELAISRLTRVRNGESGYAVYGHGSMVIAHDSLMEQLRDDRLILATAYLDALPIIAQVRYDIVAVRALHAEFTIAHIRRVAELESTIEFQAETIRGFNQYKHIDD